MILALLAAHWLLLLVSVGWLVALPIALLVLIIHDIARLE